MLVANQLYWVMGQLIHNLGMFMVNTTSDRKVLGLATVFQCAVDFLKHVHMIWISNVFATHNL